MKSYCQVDYSSSFSFSTHRRNHSGGCVAFPARDYFGGCNAPFVRSSNWRCGPPFPVGGASADHASRPPKSGGWAVAVAVAPVAAVVVAAAAEWHWRVLRWLGWWCNCCCCLWLHHPEVAALAVG